MLIDNLFFHLNTGGSRIAMIIDNTNPKVNKEDLISRVSAEFLAQYIAQATGSTVKRDGNGYRVGHNRGISVSMKNGVAIWHDFTTEIGGTFVEAVYVFEKGGADSQIPPTDYPAVLESAARTLSIPLPVQQQPIIESEKPAVTDDEKIAQIAVIKERYYSKWQEGLKCEAAQNILNKRGINPLLIDTTHIGYTERSIFSWGSKTPKIDDAFIFWNPDFTAFKTMRFDHETGHRVKETFGTMTFCAQSGDYFFSPDGVTEGESITLVESEFDALLLKSYGIPSIALKVTPNNANKIRFDATFLLYDNDDAGDGFTKKAKSCIRNAKDYRHFVSINGFKSKDIGDLIEGLPQEKRGEFMNNLKNNLVLVDDDFENANLKNECFYYEHVFNYDDEYAISKEDFDAATTSMMIQSFKAYYRILGRCNGRLVIKKNNELVSVTKDQLMDVTRFITAKGEYKRLTKEAEGKILNCLSTIYNDSALKYIPITPKIPQYPNTKESEDFADRIEKQFDSFVDSKSRKSLTQYKRVIGYILSGEFWREKERRFFLNIVSPETGIGKTGLLANALLRNIGLCKKSVAQSEVTNQFTYADCDHSDLLVFDDVTTDACTGMKALLTNVISNASMSSERKGENRSTINGYKPFIIITGNSGFYFSDATGLCTKKRALVEFLPQKAGKKGESINQERRIIECNAASLCREAEEKPGIEMAFLQRCAQEYENNKGIEDLLCSQSDSSITDNLFDTFLPIYDLKPVKSIVKGRVDIARAFSEGMSRDSVKSEFVGKNGVLDVQRIKLRFAEIVKTIKLNSNLGIEFCPQYLQNEKIEPEGIAWCGKKRSKSEEKNCTVTIEEWGRLQEWLRSIDPIREEEDTQSNEPSPYEKYCTENGLHDLETTVTENKSFLAQHGYTDEEEF